MKRKLLISITIVLITIASAKAQKDSLDLKNYKNELGTDATGLFTKIFNGSTPTNFNILYKRHFKKNIIKLMFTTNYYKKISDNEFIELKSHIKNHNFMVGYERKYNLNSSWKIFYGLGLDYDYQYTFGANKVAYSYVRNSTIESYTLGVGANLGIKYQINQRISISTETNYFYKIKNESNSIVYSIIDNTSENIPSNTFENNNTNYTDFTPPVILVFSFYF